MSHTTADRAVRTNTNSVIGNIPFCCEPSLLDYHLDATMQNLVLGISSGPLLCLISCRIVNFFFEGLSYLFRHPCSYTCDLNNTYQYLCIKIRLPTGTIAKIEKDNVPTNLKFKELGGQKREKEKHTK